MLLTPRMVAEGASFQAFVNCYLREIDSGKWLNTAQAECGGSNIFEVALILTLPRVGISLLLEVSYRSVVGCHQFGEVCQKNIIDGEWQSIDKFFALQLLVREIYQSQQILVSDNKNDSELLKIKEAELLARLFDSYQVMTRFLDEHNTSAPAYLGFLLSEQSCLIGHWLHPTPKSRQGMSFWQQAAYSPELSGKFQLNYFSVDQSLVKQGCVLECSASDLIEDDLRKSTDIAIPVGHVLIPIHPLQAQNLKLQTWVRELLASGELIDLGPLGAEFTPTSSVRTVTAADADWMYKFSIPVKITNSLRSNMRDELEDGMAVERYLRKSGFLTSRPEFKVVDDPAYITLERPGQENIESGFEVVLRRNLFKGEADKGICSILALVQDPIANDWGVAKSCLHTIISRLAEDEGRSEKAVAIDWFVRYWRCAIESLILLYDSHGIALEAHQQNSLLDVSGGYPSCYFYRDNQGFYLSNQYAESLAEVDEMATMSEMFYDDKVIHEAIAYYVLINQLFSVVYRLGADKLVPECETVQLMRELFVGLRDRLKGAGREFVDDILSSPVIAYKTNLLARVRDVDELHQGMEHAVYATLKNPLCTNVNSVDSSQSKVSGVESYVA